MNPYVYCLGNPVNLIDPTGMEAEEVKPPGDFFDKNGNYLGKDNINDKKIYIADSVHKDGNGFVDRAKNKTELDLNSDTGKLSRIIFAEARGENRTEKESVADVIKNRVNSKKFPNTYEKVIKQPYQFSSLLPGDSNKTFYDNPLSKTDNKANNVAWLDCVGAAIKVMNSPQSLTNGSLLYYSPDSMRPKGAIPKWDFSLLQEVKIDGVRANRFKFYKDK